MARLNARVVWALVSVSSASWCGAEVRTVAQYRLGEDDPGAAAAAIGNETTVDRGADKLNLTRSGSPHYSADTPFGAGLSMQFSGTTIDAYYRVPPVTLKTDDVGIEAWAKSAAAGGTERGVIAYDGLRAEGFGLVRIPDATPFGGKSAVYAGMLGDTIVGMAAVPDDVWTHLALVRDGGVAAFYVNGAAVGTSAGPIKMNPEQAFSIGAGYCAICDRPIGTEQYFDGLVDDVRVFDFTAGRFAAATDLSYRPVPEPSGMATLAFMLVGCRRWQRARRLH